MAQYDCGCDINDCYCEESVDENPTIECDSDGYIKNGDYEMSLDRVSYKNFYKPIRPQDYANNSLTMSQPRIGSIIKSTTGDQMMVLENLGGTTCRAVEVCNRETNPVVVEWEQYYGQIDFGDLMYRIDHEINHGIYGAENPSYYDRYRG
jgi:hypothetical protein